MGVRGLTSLCATIEPHIAAKVELAARTDAAHAHDGGSSTDDSARTAFVVDAWAFLYHSFQTVFGDAVHGGEYAPYASFVTDCVAAWRSVGLRPIFVFDGAPPPSKMPTVTARLSAKAAQLALFMRSAPDSRLSIRWQTSCGWIPPLIAHALLGVLRRIGCEIVLASGEADPVIVALAGQLSGYAVSRDSDMFVLNPPGGKYKGYVPLDTIAYVCQKAAPPAPAQQAATDSTPEDDDGFTAVSSGRKGRRGRGAAAAASTAASNTAATGTPPVIQAYPPPKPATADASTALTLTAVTFSTYLPSKLAAHFDLPSTLLPMLGPILGNDTSSPSHFRVLFPSSSGSGAGGFGAGTPAPSTATADGADGSSSSAAAAAAAAAGGGANSNAAQRALLCIRALREEWVYTTTGAGRNLGSTVDGRRTSTPSVRSGTGSRGPSMPASPRLIGSPAGAGAGRGGSAWKSRAPGPAAAALSARLGTASRGTPTPRAAPSSSSSTTSPQPLDSSFVSIRSLGSNGTISASGGGGGVSTPRGPGTASEWGDNEDDEDGFLDSASLASEAVGGAGAPPPPPDPVRALIVAVVRRIVLAYSGAGSSSAASPTALPMAHNRRRTASGSTGAAVPGEGSAQWEETIDAILEGVRAYTTLLQMPAVADEDGKTGGAVDELVRADAARFTAHLQRDHPSASADADADADSPLLIDADDADTDPTRADRVRALQKYADAFRAHALPPAIPSILFARQHTPMFGIEDPDQSSAGVHAARDVRRWAYAVLFGAYGLEWARETIEEAGAAAEGSGSGSSEEDSGGEGVSGARPVRGGLTSSWIMPDARESDGDPDELVLVQTPPSVSSYVETDSGGSESDEDDDAQTRAREAALAERARGREMLREDEIEGRPAPVVVELVRRGERFAAEAVPIPSLADLFAEQPVENEQETRRFDALLGRRTEEGQRAQLPRVQVLLEGGELAQALWLHALRCGPGTAALGRHLQPLAGALRCLLLSEGLRWGVSAPRHNWRRRELEAACYAGCVGVALWRGREGEEATAGMRTRNAGVYPGWYARLWAPSIAERARTAPGTRAIHLSSALQGMLEAVTVLSGALLLQDGDEGGAAAPASAYHEGPLFHAHLAHGGAEGVWTSAEVEEEVGAVLGAVLEGVGSGVLGKDVEEERREKRRAKKRREDSSSAEADDGGGGGGSSSSKDQTKAKTIANLYAALQVE